MVFTPRALMIVSVVVGAVAVTTLALSVSTDAWLYTKETTEKGLSRNDTVKIVHSHMGLWKVCTDKHVVTMCFAYDSLDPETETRVDVTSMAIMRGTRVAAMFPVVALILITVAVILGILGNVKRDIKTLIAAVIFILSGLTLAVGIIFYISAINDEVGHKERGKNGKMFTYEYGWSFSFAGLAFIISEATAVVFVTLYMQRNSNKDDMVRMIPGLEDKFGSSRDLDGGHSNPTIIL